MKFCFCISKYEDCVWEKYCEIELSSQFFIEYHFCLKEQLIDALWLFRHGDLAGIFSKKNEASLSP